MTGFAFLITVIMKISRCFCEINIDPYQDRKVIIYSYLFYFHTDLIIITYGPVVLVSITLVKFLSAIISHE